MMGNLKDELTALLNKFSVENESDTPDFILAEFMIKCLESFKAATNKRTDWYINCQQ